MCDHNFQILAHNNKGRLGIMYFATGRLIFTFRCSSCKETREARLDEAARNGWIEVEGEIPEPKFNRTNS